MALLNTRELRDVIENGEEPDERVLFSVNIYELGRVTRQTKALQHGIFSGLRHSLKNKGPALLDVFITRPEWDYLDTCELRIWGQSDVDILGIFAIREVAPTLGGQHIFCRALIRADKQDVIGTWLNSLILSGAILERAERLEFSSSQDLREFARSFALAPSPQVSKFMRKGAQGFNMMTPEQLEEVLPLMVLANNRLDLGRLLCATGSWAEIPAQISQVS